MTYIKRLLASLAGDDIGIDLGTANTMMQVLGKGVMVREPSVVARHKRSGAILAVGSEAKKMVGKAPESIEVVRPLKDGVIADFDAAEAMLSYYIGLITDTRHRLLPKFSGPRVVVGVPSGTTEVEARAVKDAALSAGARQAYLIEEPMAAAIGAGIHVQEPHGRMIVDIGGGTTEIAVISLGGIVVNRSVRTAGDELDETVIAYARTRHNLIIGQPTAEEVKIAIGSVLPPTSEASTPTRRVKSIIAQASQSIVADVAVMRGRDVSSGLPKSVKVEAAEIREALIPVARHIIAAIVETLEETPPELVGDILEHGIVLAGGTGQLKGLDRMIKDETRISVWVTPDPQMAVVRGASKALGDAKLLDQVKVVGGIRV